MRNPTLIRPRRGATLAEAGIVLPVFLILVIAGIDLGRAVFYWHVVGEASRQGARAAIVRGNTTPRVLSSWGPATYSGAGNDSNPIALAILPYIAGLTASDVIITAEWPDGTNSVNDPVRMTVSTTWQPFITLIFGAPTRPVTATSTMPIAF